MDHAPEETRRFFFRNTLILNPPPPKLPPLGVGVMKFTISGLIPLHMLLIGIDWPSCFRGIDVTGPRSTHSSRSPDIYTA